MVGVPSVIPGLSGSRPSSQARPALPALTSMVTVPSAVQTMSVGQSVHLHVHPTNRKHRVPQRQSVVEGHGALSRQGNAARARRNRGESTTMKSLVPSDITSRLASLRDGLLTGLVERDVAVRLALLAALAGEHLLLIGPPGTAKSL